MRQTLQLLAILVLAISATGCRHAYRDNAGNGHEDRNQYRNTDQHWGRGPHIDH
ncbi:hypothetical protein [Komagataeibacter sp. FNDCR2]|uniref:hypothetical protein n=1 Tax=Komagataeibacter sp. FNDCR2 TaxID=2878682 RepID=UPI001E2CE64C|nr:hypothetical protein [Komagataeibacter sp. FNDCR2]MCE2574327.1 hypothetical protein [Komagataeibacter sp. FNDCR2]